MQETTMTIPVDDKEQLPLNDGDTVSEQADPARALAAQIAEETCEETASQVEEEDLMPWSEQDMYMPVYNGEVHPVRADDREEITTLLQLGMKQRDFLPSYERLVMLAKASGETSAKAFIEKLCAQQEDQLLSEAIDRYGEEGGRRVYELERWQRERQCAEQASRERDSERAQEADVMNTLARQFAQLQAEYPQYSGIRQVPREVVQSALENGISLLDAQNRFVLAEQKRQTQYVAQSAAAARASTGSLRGDASSPRLTAEEAFLAGLHSRA